MHKLSIPLRLVALVTAGALLIADSDDDEELSCRTYAGVDVTYSYTSTCGNGATGVLRLRYVGTEMTVTIESGGIDLGPRARCYGEQFGLDDLSFGLTAGGVDYSCAGWEGKAGSPQDLDCTASDGAQCELTLQ